MHSSEFYKVDRKHRHRGLLCVLLAATICISILLAWTVISSNNSDDDECCGFLTPATPIPSMVIGSSRLL